MPTILVKMYDGVLDHVYTTAPLPVGWGIWFLDEDHDAPIRLVGHELDMSEAVVPVKTLQDEVASIEDHCDYCGGGGEVASEPDPSDEYRFAGPVPCEECRGSGICHPFSGAEVVD